MSEPREDGQALEPYVEELDPEATHEQRAAYAHRLRLRGLSWSVVAEYAGYDSVPAAATEVRRMLQRAAAQMDAETRAEAMLLELERLDQLQAAYWPSAMTGDAKHAELVLKVMGVRSKLLGFEELHKSQGQTTKTIVVSGTSEEYVETLKQIAES